MTVEIATSKSALLFSACSTRDEMQLDSEKMRTGAVNGSDRHVVVRSSVAVAPSPSPSMMTREQALPFVKLL